MRINEAIWDECDTMGLMVSRSQLPIKIGPDCYLLYATPRTTDCKDKGYCKEERYYALTGGNSIQITQ